MKKTYDLLNYGLAKEIVNDLPKLRVVLEKAKKDLEIYKKYRDAAQIVDKIEDAIIMLDLHLTAYETVVRNRGQIE